MNVSQGSCNDRSKSQFFCRMNQVRMLREQPEDSDQWGPLFFLHGKNPRLPDWGSNKLFIQLWGPRFLIYLWLFHLKKIICEASSRLNTYTQTEKRHFFFYERAAKDQQSHLPREMQDCFLVVPCPTPWPCLLNWLIDLWLCLIWFALVISSGLLWVFLICRPHWKLPRHL